MIPPELIPGIGPAVPRLDIAELAQRASSLFAKELADSTQRGLTRAASEDICDSVPMAT